MSSKNGLMQAVLNNNNSKQKPTTNITIHPDNGMVRGATTVSLVTKIPMAEAVEAQQRSSSSQRLRSKKVVDVTVTILSIAGMVVKDTGDGKKKKKMKGFGPMSPKKKFRNGATTNAEDNSASCSSKATSDVVAATTIVASFSRMVNTKEGKDKKLMTHVPSLQVPLPAASNTSSKKNSVIRWPEQQQDYRNGNGNGGRVLSSYQFQRTFQREDRTTTSSSNIDKVVSTSSSHRERFEPQPLPIQIAICRSGRMFKLGTAHILLSGEENGESSINVPILNFNTAIPKSNKKSFLNSSSSSIPMMKLKGDTLKCGLDPNATLRVLVHVSEPIGETLEISRNLSVTMSSNAPKRKKLQKIQNEQDQEKLHKQKDAAAVVGRTPILPSSPASSSSTDAAVAHKNSATAYPDEIRWEYNPTLRAVVVKNQVPASASTNVATSTANDEHEEPLQRVISLQDEDHDDHDDPILYNCNTCDDHHDHNVIDDYEDEPSCSSSAYMSAVSPTKSITRSYSTATTTTTISEDFSIMSDLTDQHSWLSQTGIEVIPFARTNSTIDQRVQHLPINSRLRYYEEDREKEQEDFSTAVDSRTTGMTMGSPSTASMASSLSRAFSPHLTADSRTTGMTMGSPSTASMASSLSRAFSPHLTSSKKKNWRQRLACGLPSCGPSSLAYEDYHAGGGDDDDLLSAVNEEDVISTSRYSLVGRCHPMEIQPGVSYWTEDDVDSFVEEEDDDDDDCDDASDSGSESTLCK